ncbi:MAG TPA: HAMP domain-containing histidine kinase [Bacteroidetes bacterium]|nr:HAMP domain-containing histidine kinase [Bacteroidota bacterium]
MNKFLDITRIESGKVQPNKTVVNLAEVVTTVLGNYASLAQEKDIRVDWEHPDEPVPVHADREMMTQLVLNLYSNAVKYSPPGRVVTVRLNQRGKDVVLEVEDQGYGIPKKDLPHIFDKFYRASNVAEQDSGPRGSGLGLALVQHIVRMHGGRIAVASEEGRGTRFRVTLPALRDERKKRSGIGQEDVQSWRGATETIDG